MIGMRAGAPSSVSEVSIDLTSRRTRGRRRSPRHAAAFSATVISSSAPHAQKANAPGDTRWRASSSSASNSTLSMSPPILVGHA
jgi:hypothetical protein